MKITIQSEGYKAVIDTMGAELKSFQDPQGTEYIWNSDPKYWFRSSPLLFPTVGNVRDNKTIFDGKEYPMPRHGFCKDSEFSLHSQQENSVTFLLTDSPETRNSYPYRFRLQLTYTLEKQTLHMDYSVENTDETEIPYQIGAHPGFMCPLFDEESMTDYHFEFEKEEVLAATMYDLEKMCFSATKKKKFGERGKILSLTPNMFDDDAILFPHTNSHAIRLINPNTGKGVEVSYPDFHSLGLWSVAGARAPFVCIEPWNGAAIFEDEDNLFIHKRDIERLAPGKNAEYHLSIQLL